MTPFKIHQGRYSCDPVLEYLEDNKDDFELEIRNYNDLQSHLDLCSHGIKPYSTQALEDLPANYNPNSNLIFGHPHKDTFQTNPSDHTSYPLQHISFDSKNNHKPNSGPINNSSLIVSEALIDLPFVTSHDNPSSSVHISDPIHDLHTSPELNDPYPNPTPNVSYPILDARFHAILIPDTNPYRKLSSNVRCPLEDATFATNHNPTPNPMSNSNPNDVYPIYNLPLHTCPTCNPKPRHNTTQPHEDNVFYCPDFPGIPIKSLPEKGKLLEAVVQAGPLLHTLLIAGVLPKWEHPPPPLVQETSRFPKLRKLHRSSFEFVHSSPSSLLTARSPTSGSSPKIPHCLKYLKTVRHEKPPFTYQIH